MNSAIRTLLLGVPLLVLPSLVAARADTQRLLLPADLPEQFEIVVQIDEAQHSLLLRRHSLRAPGFRTRAFLPNGETIEVAPPAVATYRGSIAGDTQAVVIADLRGEGIHARIVYPNGANWTIRPLPGGDRSSGAAEHEVLPGPVWVGGGETAPDSATKRLA